MRFPSKVTTYKESVMSKFVPFLEKVKERDYPIVDLYDSLKKKMSICDFIEAIDCLYVLNKIEVERGIVIYVNRNTI